MSWRDPKFKYIPVGQQGDGYLKKRFKRIQADQKAKATATAEKVTILPRSKTK